jgi:hypothetical protein
MSKDFKFCCSVFNFCQGVATDASAGALEYSLAVKIITHWLPSHTQRQLCFFINPSPVGANSEIKIFFSLN